VAHKYETRSQHPRGQHKEQQLLEREGEGEEQEQEQELGYW